MALLDEGVSAREQARRAKFRLRHVGTKLNEAEGRALDELAARRNQTHAELIRGLILAEIERDKPGVKPSLELTEITACRLLLTHLLRPVAMGERIAGEAFDNLVAEVKQHKARVAGDRLREYLARR